VTSPTAAVVVNPRKVGDLGRARRLLERVAASVGQPTPLWWETTADDTGEGQAREAREAGVDVVLAWGGDGTIMSVAAALEGTETSLGVVPGGTGNLLARNLDIPLDAEGAIRTALTGDDHVIDLLDVYLGKGVRRLSSVMCGMGWDAAMMGASETLKRRVGWGAYAIEGVKHMREQPMRLRLSVDGGPQQVLFGRTVLVANVGMLVGGIDLIPEASASDGHLDVLVVDPSTPLDWMRMTGGILRGKGAADDPSRTHLIGREVVVSTGATRGRQVDGDPVSDGHGFRVRLLPEALRVRVPRS
jgi:diacylglycerol kinase family enzyme